MSQVHDNRGSMWRKWDLHVHTPESYQQKYGEDWAAYVSDLINQASKHDIEVACITDYFSVDGYQKLITEYARGNTYLDLPNGKKLHLMPAV